MRRSKPAKTKTVHARRACCRSSTSNPTCIRSSPTRFRRTAPAGKRSQPDDVRPVTVIDASDEEGARAADRSAGRRHGPSGRARRSAQRSRRTRSSAAVDLGVGASASPRVDSLAPVHAALRQQPASRRASRRLAERAGRRAARPVAPRLAGARRAQRGRGSAQGRAHQGARRHLVARARHRHGRHRSRRPDRGAAVGGQRTAADRARRTSGGCGQRRHHLSEVPRRSRRVRRGRACDARGPRRIDAVSAQPARRARPADRRDGCARHLVGGRAVRRWSDAPRRSRT